MKDISGCGFRIGGEEETTEIPKNFHIYIKETYKSDIYKHNYYKMKMTILMTF